MTSKHVKLLYFMVTFPLIFGGSNTTRFHLDSDVRGNSFGLENFLFQTYKDVAPKESTHRIIAKPKRVRPQSYRAPSLDRGQTYGLENLAPQVYYSNRLKPSPVRPQPQYQIYVPKEPFLELNKSKEIPKEELTTKTTKVPELLTQETTTEDTKTERVRKRIMMKRRRKRPTNATQGENTEINVSPTLQPIKLPTISQAPTIVETKLLIQDSNEEIKPTTQEQLIRTTPQTKEDITEVVTEQEVVTEYSTRKETPKSSTVKEATTNKPYTLNLKTFLKQQTETLSLSELLQTQNLSLADLLRNSKDASAILKAKEWMSSTPSPSYGFRRKTTNRLEINKNIPESEPQRKPQSEDITTSRPSFNRFQPKFSRTKIGEKVNAKPEEKILDQNENYPREILTSTKRTIVNYNYSHKNFDPHNRLSELRLKLKNFQRKPVPSAQPEVTSPKQVKAGVTETGSITSTASSVSLLKETEKSQIKKNEISLQSANNPEIFLVLPSKLKPEVEKRPERYNRTNRLPALKRFGQDKVKQSENLIIRPLKYSNEEDDSSGQSFEQNNYKEEEPTQTITEDKVSPEEEYKPVKVPYEEELKPIKVPYERKPDSKDELIELLKFGQNADRLQKILSSRNMTIQELLDNREKPSTQTSLSELFSKKYPEFLSTTSTEPPIIFDSLPNFGMEINNFKTPEFVSYDEPYAEESVPSIATIELATNREAKQFLPIPENNKESDLTLEPDDLKADTSNVEDSALWKLSERGTYYGSSNTVGVTVRHESERTINPKNRLQESDIILLESLQRSPETNRKFRINLEDYAREESIPLAEDIEKSYVPPAVKSAIIASGVVMGIALFVFIAIFAACGWKQRQIRLKGSSSILGSTLTKTEDKSKRKNTLSPVSFKETSSYKKTIDFDNESNESGASNTSSYFWGTLKNPFRSRTNTLKTRLEKEEKMKEDRMTLRRNESRRKGEYKMNEMPIMYDLQDDRFVVRKAERDRNAINMSFNFKRTSSSNNINHFNECEHGY